MTDEEGPEGRLGFGGYPLADTSDHVVPDYPDMLSSVGRSLLRKGEHSAAVACFQDALRERTDLSLGDKEDADPGTFNFFLELTNKCNFHCEFCPSDLQERRQGFMDLALVRKVLDEVVSKNLVPEVNLHLMGEPTLHPDLNEILRYAADLGVSLVLTTNGSTLIHKKVVSLLNDLQGGIVASLMTPTPTSYETRGDVGLSWDRYIENFRTLVRERLRRRAEGLSTRCHITLRVLVTKDSSGAVQILEDHNDIAVNLADWVSFVSAVEQELGLPATSHPQVDSRLIMDITAKGVNYNYPLADGIILQFWRAFTFANTRVGKDYTLEYQETAHYCPHPFTDFGVLWNGEVTLCCLDYDGALKVGNVVDHSVEDVLKSVEAHKLRLSMLGRSPLPSYCQTCQARPVPRSGQGDAD